MKGATSVLLADEHIVVREALREVIEARDDLTVVGEAADGREVVALEAALEPDVVLMEIALPQLCGIAAMREILRRNSDARILVLSTNEGATWVNEAICAGATGYVAKRDALSDLVSAIRSVAKGQVHLSPRVVGHVVQGVRHPEKAGAGGLAGLTPREREILQLLAEGDSAKEIGRELHISSRTVETHRARLMKKLGVHKSASLVRVAIREGLVSAH